MNSDDWDRVIACVCIIGLFIYSVVTLVLYIGGV